MVRSTTTSSGRQVEEVDQPCADLLKGRGVDLTDAPSDPPPIDRAWLLSHGERLLVDAGDDHGWAVTGLLGADDRAGMDPHDLSAAGLSHR